MSANNTIPGPQNLSDVSGQIHESVRDALEQAGVDLPPETERAVASVLVAQASSFFEVPLPPPALLRQYDAALPGLSRQIADMARAEQKHRHRWEMGALRNDVFTQSGGLLLGWLLAVGCVAGYAALIAYHYPALAATPLLGPPILAIIKTMLPGKPSQPSSGTQDNGNAPAQEPGSSRTD